MGAGDPAEHSVMVFWEPTRSVLGSNSRDDFDRYRGRSSRAFFPELGVYSTDFGVKERVVKKPLFRRGETR